MRSVTYIFALLSISTGSFYPLTAEPSSPMDISETAIGRILSNHEVLREINKAVLREGYRLTGWQRIHPNWDPEGRPKIQLNFWQPGTSDQVGYISVRMTTTDDSFEILKVFPFRKATLD